MTATICGQIGVHPPAPRPAISVIVCTYDEARFEQLRAAVNSVIAQSCPPSQTIVVTDGNPLLADRVRRSGWPVEVVSRPQRGGSAAACNTGILHAAGEIVAFLDDDATADSEWLDRLVRHFRDPSTGGVSGSALPLWEGGGQPGWFPAELLWTVGCSYRGLPSESAEVRNVFGGCAAFRRSLFAEAGLFSEDLGRHGHRADGGYEAEFCLRASRLTGTSFRYEPAARITHRVPASRASLGYVLRRAASEGACKARVRSLTDGDALLPERRFLADAARGILGRRHDATLAGRLVLASACMSAAITYLGSYLGHGRGHGAAVPGQADVPTLRVTQVAAQTRPALGGIETHVYEVSRRLQERIRLRILTTDRLGNLPRHDKVDGVQIDRVSAWPRRRDWYFAPGIVWKVIRQRPDVVHCQGIHTFVPVMAMLAAWATRTPYVVTFHTGGHSSATRHALRATQWRVLAPLLRRAAALVAVCRYEVDIFSHVLGVPADRFVVIRNGADVEDAGDPTSPAESGAKGPLIVSVGRLERYKGHHRAIEALAVLRQADPGVRLVIAGSGPFENELDRLAHRLGVADAVTIQYFPPEERPALTSLLESAACVTLLSEYEAHPVAVVEALALGTPVVVASTSGLCELAEDGLVDAVPIDASPAAVADAFRTAMGARRPRVALNTWDDCSEALAELYSAVAAGKVRRW